jgi:hypothetical protein
MRIECEITDPEVMGAVFALLGQQSPCDLHVHMEDAPEAQDDPDTPIPYTPTPEAIAERTASAERMAKVALVPEPDPEVAPEPRVAITPPPPVPAADNPLAEETPAPEPAKKRGRPKKGEQTVLPSGPVNADRYMDALNAARARWGVEAVRGIIRDIAHVEKPQDVPEALWGPVVDACNAYTGGDTIDMSEFL